MAKVKIKTNIENKYDKTIVKSEAVGIKTANKISYNDNQVKTIITIEEDALIIERITGDYTIHLHISRNNITKGYYNIYGVGTIDVNIRTNKLINKSNEIYLEYTIIFDEKEKKDFIFSLEWEENI